MVWAGGEGRGWDGTGWVGDWTQMGIQSGGKGMEKGLGIEDGMGSMQEGTTSVRK